MKEKSRTHFRVGKQIIFLFLAFSALTCKRKIHKKSHKSHKRHARNVTISMNSPEYFSHDRKVVQLNNGGRVENSKTKSRITLGGLGGDAKITLNMPPPYYPKVMVNPSRMKPIVVVPEILYPNVSNFVPLMRLKGAPFIRCTSLMLPVSPLFSARNGIAPIFWVAIVSPLPTFVLLVQLLFLLIIPSSLPVLCAVAPVLTTQISGSSKRD